jgi:hypothetical protein
MPALIMRVKTVIVSGTMIGGQARNRLCGGSARRDRAFSSAAPGETPSGYERERGVAEKARQWSVPDAQRR